MKSNFPIAAARLGAAILLQTSDLRFPKRHYGGGGALVALCFIILYSCFCLRAWGQYSVGWSKVAAGGGTSANGQYVLSGTIGQPDAGSMSGGNYTLQGGFWGVVAAVQAPGAPLLTLTPSGTNVIVSWPSPSTGFGLQENSDLNPANWSAVPPTNSDNFTIKSIIVPAGPGNRFYRLKK